MSFLRFYGEDAPDRDLPARVYARVDTHEPPDGKLDDERTLLLDCVDADWFDRVRREVAWLGAVSDAEWQVSVVEMHLEPGHEIRDERTQEGEWLLLEFGDGIEVVHYMNLFDAGVPRRARGFYRPQPDVDHDLDRVTGFDDLHDATPAEIDALLPQHRARAAAVYDVGQGNANALLEHSGAPILYYDLGGGVLGNRHTFPAALTRFCQSFKPPIVLSHWDWDHWSSAQRDLRALQRTWVVPRQRLGPTHTAFLGQLRASGQVLVWPAGVPAVGGGDIRIELCTGPPSSRNDTGLALVWDPDHGRMLFPGDGAYRHVPSGGLDWTSVVVPHHGGRTSLKVVAARDGQPAGRLAWSYGAGNRYNHPLLAMVNAHVGGWPQWQQLETPARGPDGLGHVHLYWDPVQPNAPPPCGGANCDLTLHQR